LAPSPLIDRIDATSVWTGQEWIVWGGEDLARPASLGDGAAYDAATDTWRSLTPGPAHPGFMPVWTGELLPGFFKGGVVGYDQALDGWVVDFAGSGLSHLDRAPVWTGAQVLLLGSYDERFGGAMFNPQRPG
jgi:hypothetical protein